MIPDVPPRRRCVRTATAAVVVGVALASAVVVAPAARAAGTAAAPVAATLTPGWGWGVDGHGQLGARPTSTATTPVPVALPPGTTALAEGADTTYALAGTTLWSFGRGDAGQLGTGVAGARTAAVRVPLPPVRAVAAGDQHALAVGTDGSLWAWGRSEVGELAATPGTVLAAPTRVALPGGARAAAVATGSDHTLVVTTAGRVLAFGSGGSGQLGDGRGADSARPVTVALPTGVRVVAAAVGDRHSLALTDDGRLFGWGGDTHGQLGAGVGGELDRPHEVPLPGGARAVAVAAGTATSEVVTADGAVWAWGLGDHGQLGVGARTSRTTATRVALPAGVRIGTLAVGPDHTVALTTDRHHLYTWGRGDLGRLGVGSGTDALTPSLVGLPGTGTRTIAALAAGGATTVLATTPGPLAALVAGAVPHPSVTGRAVTFTARGRDAAGDDLGPLPVLSTATGAAGAACSAAVCSFARPGVLHVRLAAVADADVTATVLLVVVGAPVGTPSGSPPPSGTGTPTPTVSSSPSGTGSATAGGQGPRSTGALPFTGVAVTGLLLAAVVAVAAGTAFTVAARRRRTTTPEDRS